MSLCYFPILFRGISGPVLRIKGCRIYAALLILLELFQNVEAMKLYEIYLSWLHVVLAVYVHNRDHHVQPSTPSMAQVLVYDRVWVQICLLWTKTFPGVLSKIHQEVLDVVEKFA